MTEAIVHNLLPPPAAATVLLLGYKIPAVIEILFLQEKDSNITHIHDFNSAQWNEEGFV